MLTRIRPLGFVAAMACAALLLGSFTAWRVTAAPEPNESTFVPVTPTRILDTRDPINVGLANPFVSPVSQKLTVTGAVPPPAPRPSCRSVQPVSR